MSDPLNKDGRVAQATLILQAFFQRAPEVSEDRKGTVILTMRNAGVDLNKWDREYKRWKLYGPLEEISGLVYRRPTKTPHFVVKIV